MERALRKKLSGGKFKNVSTERSRLMGRIRSKGNLSTEQSIRLALVRSGVRGWILHPKFVFGTPDFYFVEHRLAVFIDGCFWHGCKKCGHIPRTRTAFWRMKFNRNKARSRLVAIRLRHTGIKSMRFWEHDVKLNSREVVRKIQDFLSGR